MERSPSRYSMTGTTVIFSAKRCTDPSSLLHSTKLAQQTTELPTPEGSAIGYRGCPMEKPFARQK
jgi:hypothetical protein